MGTVHIFPYCFPANQAQGEEELGDRVMGATPVPFALSSLFPLAFRAVSIQWLSGFAVQCLWGGKP